MKKTTLYVAFFILASLAKLQAQETYENKMKEVTETIKITIKKEKKLLKHKIDSVENLVNNGKISKAEAVKIKQKLVETIAQTIELKINDEQEKLSLIINDLANGKLKTDTLKLDKKSFITRWRYKQPGKDSLKIYKPKRTTSHFTFALGLNNVLTENKNLENSDFRIIGSHFYEWGYNYNTRVFKNDNFLHVRYGFSVMYNNLRPTDNRIFVKNGNQTKLETYPKALKDSRLRHVQLVFPAHFEFDFGAKSINKKGEIYFKNQRSFRLGIGGYAGVSLKTKQLFYYKDDGFEKIKQKNNFNTSDFIYGLSTYIGYKNTSLYFKYDLNPFFADNPIKQNNISAGVRFDFD